MNFIDIHQIHEEELEFVKLTFCNEFYDLVNSYLLNANKSNAVANSLFDLMSNKNLHYHTPIHVLAMFSFAKQHNIALNDYEQLAVWFHDAVYEPNQNNNEEYSAKLMRIYLKGMPEYHLEKIETLIMATSRHLSPDVDVKFHKILDLDLCGFSLDRDNYNKITECLRKEFAVDEKKFNAGRKSFLYNLISKGFVYRSPEFDRFEPLAQENIRLDLKELNE